MSGYSYKDGRIWLQTKKFQVFDQLLPYGMTDITDPAGTLNAVRQPAAGRRRETVVVDILRGEPGLSSFNIETRFFHTLNYMLSLRKKTSNFQIHLGACDRPDDYYRSQVGLFWERVRRGDGGIDRIGMLQGDDAPIALTSPFSGEIGPIPIDFLTEFVSARAIPEPQGITDIAMLVDECDDISIQYDPGDNGYLATEAGASVYAIANVWYTTDAWESAAITSANPFASGHNISAIAVLGSKEDHRVIVADGTADGGPATIAYADVTEMGTTVWVTVTVGSVNGQVINHFFWLDWTRLFAVTNDGYVYRSRDGGASWTAVYTTGVVSLNEVTALRSGIVWVGGASNTILMSEDFGDTWDVVSGPSGGSGDDILTIDVTPDGTVYIGNDAGESYGSYNKGDDWTTLSMQGIVPTAVDRIRHYSDTILWTIASTAGQSYALRSTDGGASFRLWSLNMPENSGLSALFPVNQDYVMVGGAAHNGAAFLSKTKSNLTGLVVRLLD